MLKETVLACHYANEIPETSNFKKGKCFCSSNLLSGGSIDLASIRMADGSGGAHREVGAYDQPGSRDYVRPSTGFCKLLRTFH